jgi:hypothetical protein
MADRNGYIGRAPGDSTVIVARQTNQPTTTTSTFVFNSGYDVGYLDVYLNGSKLVNALDYTATDTQNVSLTTAAQNGDVIEFVAYKAFNLTNVITQTSGDLIVDGSVTVEGGVTATDGTFSGDVTATDGTFSGDVTANQYFGDGSTLTGVGVGIQSGGDVVGTGITTLNFIGVGNTFKVDGNTIDISITGGGGGAIGLQSGGEPVAFGITDVNIAIGSTTSRRITGSGTTATIDVDLGEYYIFRKAEAGFATMRVLIAGANGGIAKSDYLGGSSHVGLTTVNTDQFPWVSGIGLSISSSGHLIFTVP